MRMLVVEASPLAQNVYRLLLRQYLPACGTTPVGALDDLVHLDPELQFMGMLIGSGALIGSSNRYRALLTDAARWANLPKLVIIPSQRNGDEPPSATLPRAQVLQRPFRPAAFQQRVQALFGAVI